MKRMKIAVAATVAAVLVCFGGSALAAGDKIGVIDVQKILRTSKAGKKATTSLDEKMASFKKKFKGEGEKLKELEEEIKKKSSAWSADKKKTKIHEYQKAAVAFQQKTKDAQFELKQARDKKLSPLFEKLEKVIDDFGKKNGYAIIIDRTPGIAFVNPGNDITDEVIKALDRVAD